MNKKRIFNKIRIKKRIGLYKSKDFIKDLRKLGVKIGENCVIYSPKDTTVDLTSANFISIGNNVQITEGCIILAHDYSYSVVANIYREFLRPQKNTIIGNNVFIGVNSIILMGSSIGDNIIIGAGSVVTGTLESNYVYAGNPAKKICSIQEFYYKLKSNYIKSAQCYAKAILKSKGQCKIDDMIIYKSLFLDEQNIKKYIIDTKWGGVCKDSIINAIIDNNSFESIDELLKSLK